MPANSSGWIWHCLARETRRIGHLYSPNQQRGPWPWLPFALDNGAFSLWDSKTGTFDEERWLGVVLHSWRRLLFWTTAQSQRPLWAIVPDRPGDWLETERKWETYAHEVIATGIPLAVAVQNGATVAAVRALSPQPDVIAVGGDTEWKWATAETWLKEFPRVHLLRCNSPEKLYWLEERGCESCDGTGWNRGDRTQTQGLERRARGLRNRHEFELWPHASRARCAKQTCFA